MPLKRTKGLGYYITTFVSGNMALEISSMWSHNAVAKMLNCTTCKAQTILMDFGLQ